MPHIPGTDLLPEIMVRFPGIPVIIILIILVMVVIIIQDILRFIMGR
jgi:hypothetical protein